MNYDNYASQHSCIGLNELAFQRQILNELDEDYSSLSNLRATCGIYKKLIAEKCPEMNLWQERSLRKYTLQTQIDMARLEKIHLESLAAESSRYASGMHSTPLNSPHPLKNYLYPVEALDTPQRRKQLQLKRLEIELSRLKEMCRGLCTLLDEEHPITELVGGCKKVLLAPEVNSEGMQPSYTPIMKAFDPHGNLSILISDQEASIFELKISHWATNLICKLSGEGCSYLRQFNATVFSHEADETFKCEVLRHAEQPFWTISQKIHNTYRDEKPFFFGICCNLQKLLYLEQAIQRTQRES